MKSHQNISKSSRFFPNIRGESLPLTSQQISRGRRVRGHQHHIVEGAIDAAAAAIRRVSVERGHGGVHANHLGAARTSTWLKARQLEVSMGVPLVIIHFKGIFPYKPSSYWGTPIYGKPQLGLSWLVDHDPGHHQSPWVQGAFPVSKRSCKAFMVG